MHRPQALLQLLSAFRHREPGAGGADDRVLFLELDSMAFGHAAGIFHFVSGRTEGRLGVLDCRETGAVVRRQQKHAGADVGILFHQQLGDPGGLGGRERRNAPGKIDIAQTDDLPLAVGNFAESRLPASASSCGGLWEMTYTAPAARPMMASETNHRTGISRERMGHLGRHFGKTRDH